MLKIAIPSDIVKKIERYDYACKSRQEIIENIIKNQYNISNHQLDYYQKDYDEKYYLFMKEKSNFEKEYVNPYVKDNEKINWKLDYNTCILFIYN